MRHRSLRTLLPSQHPLRLRYRRRSQPPCPLRHIKQYGFLCSELNINIEDVTQSILQGMFAMIMLVDISKCSVSHEELHQRMDALAKEMGMQINLTRQEVFDAMHTI